MYIIPPHLPPEKKKRKRQGKRERNREAAIASQDFYIFVLYPSYTALAVSSRARISRNPQDNGTVWNPFGNLNASEIGVTVQDLYVLPCIQVSPSKFPIRCTRQCARLRLLQTVSCSTVTPCMTCMHFNERARRTACVFSRHEFLSMYYHVRVTGTCICKRFVPQCLCSLDSARDPCKSYRVASAVVRQKTQELLCLCPVQDPIPVHHDSVPKKYTILTKIVIQYTQQCPSFNPHADCAVTT
jgi:hypothetical protein